jgi:hypothetical protein
MQAVPTRKKDCRRHVLPCCSSAYSIRFSPMPTDSTISSANNQRRPSANLPPAALRWLLPSVGDLFFIALFSLLVFTNLSSRLLGDSGIGWHIRTGQLILSTHQIPHTDPFSSSMNGHPWFAWEWLYDVIVGWLANFAGLNGVVVFTAFIIALTFWLAFRWLVHRGVNILLALLLVLLAMSASMIHFFARPHVVSWLFAFIWVSILDSAERDYVAESLQQQNSNGKNSSQLSLWLLPPAMLLWVNLHGGFLIGFVLLAAYWVSALWDWLRAGSDRSSLDRPNNDRFDRVLLKIRAGRRLKKLTLVGIISAASTLVNPYGFQLYRHIYAYLSNRFLMNHIDEFQSPNFHYIAQKCFAGLLLLALVVLATGGIERRKLRLSHAILILFAIYSGLYASRNIPISSLLLILVTGPRLSKELEHFAETPGPHLPGFRATEFFRRMQKIELSLRGHAWPIAVVTLTCWITAHSGKLGASTVLDAQFSSERFPVAAVNYIEKQNLPGPFFSPDSWGGYLIYRFYPQSKVVVDDRHDFYGESFLRSYLKMIHVEPGWQDFLRQHPARCLVIPKDSALANILAESPDWRSVYRDRVANVFVPSETNRE